eukprot:6478368-Amphidinium_carterae.2
MLGAWRRQAASAQKARDVGGRSDLKSKIHFEVTSTGGAHQDLLSGGLGYVQLFAVATRKDWGLIWTHGLTSSME